MRVLIADEDPKLLKVALPLLRRRGHRVYVRHTPGDLPDFVVSEGIHLLIWEPDLFSFGMALDLCYSLREESPTTFMLVVSRLTSLAERVRLLEAGVDDYLNKPIDPAEFAARVQALLRRHPLATFVQGEKIVRITDRWRLDLAGQQLIGEGQEVPLSRYEFRLLAYMIRNEGIVLSRENLLDGVWGPGYEGSTREVDTYIHYLRRKLEPDPSDPSYILTVWGTGYRYVGPVIKNKSHDASHRCSP